MEPARDSSAPTQYLTFIIANEEYAINILRLREITEFTTITAVPTVPRCILGVINLRGSVVPVVDLAIKFGLPETKITKWTCIIIVELEIDGERTVMGVIADLVSQVIDLRPQDIEPPPPFGTKVRVDFLLGMGKTENKFVLILDIDKVLSTHELLAVATLPAAAAEADSSPLSES